MKELAVRVLTEIYSAALPIAMIFELGNLAVGVFLRAALRGKLWFGVK